LLDNAENTNDFKANTNQLNNEPFLNVSDIKKINYSTNRFKYNHPLPMSDHFMNLATKREVDHINPLWYFVPTGFQIGFNWNPVGIAKLPNANNKVKTIGLSGEIEFTKNTRLQIGLEYLSVPLSAEAPEEFSQFPTITPNNPDDILKELYGNFTYLQVPLTFKYVVQPAKKWSPTVGIGMITRLPLKEEFQYEFVSIQGGEYTNNQPLNEGSFSISNWRATAGVDYNFYKNYTLQVEGFYNHQFGDNPNTYFNLRYGGLNLGLKYKF